jgi:uncharacterized membrane protein YeaQ/YmgE (transglycosylase-associated protein family)
MVTDIIILVFGAAAGAYVEGMVQKQLPVALFGKVTQGQVAAFIAGLIVAVLPDMAKLTGGIKAFLQALGVTISGVSLANMVSAVMTK